MRCTRLLEFVRWPGWCAAISFRVGVFLTGDINKLFAPNSIWPSGVTCYFFFGSLGATGLSLWSWKTFFCSWLMSSICASIFIYSFLSFDYSSVLSTLTSIILFSWILGFGLPTEEWQSSIFSLLSSLVHNNLFNFFRSFELLSCHW